MHFAFVFFIFLTHVHHPPTDLCFLSPHSCTLSENCSSLWHFARGRLTQPHLLRHWKPTVSVCMFANCLSPSKKKKNTMNKMHCSCINYSLTSTHFIYSVIVIVIHVRIYWCNVILLMQTVTVAAFVDVNLQTWPYSSYILKLQHRNQYFCDWLTPHNVNVVL